MSSPIAVVAAERPRPDAPARRDTVLVVAGRRRDRESLARLATANGHLALQASNADEVRAQFRDARPELVLLPGDRNGMRVLSELRADADAGSVAAIVLTRDGDLATILRAFELGADDVVSRSADRRELATRIRARLDRRAIPRAEVVRDPVTGALTAAALARVMRLEFERVRRTRRAAVLAYLALEELPAIEAERGQHTRDALLAQVVELIEGDGRRIDLIGFSRGQLTVLLPDTGPRGGRVRLNRLAQRIYHHRFMVDGGELRLTPTIGFAGVEPETSVGQAQDRAWDALMRAAGQLDLYPVEWDRRMGEDRSTSTGGLRALVDRHRTAVQVIAQQLACVGLPVLAYALLDGAGWDVTGAVYLAVVVALALTALAIWVECLSAFRPEQPPRRPARPYPPASAIIAAYLPNEADTIVAAVRAMLRQDYPALQVILAYNTPRDLAVEEELRAIADQDPRFLPLRIRDSVSKAQNVNAALSMVTGEFVGVFDADHHPAPGSFKRAWRWISTGADVVQGHCVVRNGTAGYVQRLVAAEFEAIYAVAHPGRARVQGFGIFGGSNGYWRTSLLRRTRMRGFMLTEDIDASMRVVADGGRIVSDPGLVSTELAPPSWGGLWNQRLRWAQGWSQVSLRHLLAMLRSRRLTRRQRFGLVYLLGWREIYPWVSLQAFPILGYWFLRGTPPIDWFVPVFVFTTLFTTSAGVMQAWSSWRLARPELRRDRRRWFVAFAIASLAYYTEYKNVMTRTAHLKELMREQQWKVTPRSAQPATPFRPSRTPSSDSSRRPAPAPRHRPI